MKNKNGVSFLGLVMLVISSAIGAGIYNASAQLAAVATPGPALLAWLITGAGIFGLALSLKSLSETHPELDGISDYARAGFGNLAGFLSGWGYWLSSWLGSVAFATMMMSAVGYFIPSFRSGNSLPAIIVASIISWLLTILVVQGIESAAFINTIVTIVKLVPLVAMIILGVVMFKANVFTAHFWNNFSNNFTYQPATAGGVFEQVKGCIITMMWIFIGIEGAMIMSGRARKRTDASKATIIGFISILLLNIIISMLPYGYLSQAELAKVSNPALTYVVAEMIGPVGGALVSISLIITIAGAWLSWTLLPVESTSQMVRQKLLPNWFGYLNKNNTPSHALWLTQILLQLFLASLIFTDSAYNFAISMCTAAMFVCYVLVGFYQIKVGIKKHSIKLMLPGMVAVLFEIAGMVFSGMQYLWLCSIPYVLGFIFYGWAVKERGDHFTRLEYLMMGFILIAAITSMIALAMGKIAIS